MSILVQLQKQFDAYLNSHPFAGNPSKLYDAKNYLISIGGKRARPIALLAAIAACGENVEKGMEAAWCFEVFHNFTLAHDDIMDNAAKRRGQPALHTKYDEPTAILAGDNMMLYVYKHLLHYPSPLSNQLMELLTHTGIEICEGQFMDMQFEEEENVSAEDYIEMIKLKTAVLLGACFKAGALIAGADQKNAEKLYDIGVDLGIGFQMMDDMLDAFSENPKVGKVKGGDIIANKKTILWIRALEYANEKQKNELNKWQKVSDFNPDTKVSETLAIFNQLNVKAKVEAERDEYYSRAKENILSLPIANQAPLMEFYHFITARTH